MSPDIRPNMSPQPFYVTIGLDSKSREIILMGVARSRQEADQKSAERAAKHGAGIAVDSFDFANPASARRLLMDFFVVNGMSVDEAEAATIGVASSVAQELLAMLAKRFAKGELAP